GRGRDTTRMPLASRARIVRSMIGLPEKGYSCCRIEPGRVNGGSGISVFFIFSGFPLSPPAPLATTATTSQVAEPNEDPSHESPVSQATPRKLPWRPDPGRRDRCACPRRPLRDRGAG